MNEAKILLNNQLFDLAKMQKIDLGALVVRSENLV